MFRKIRRKEKQLTVEECNAILTDVNEKNQKFSGFDTNFNSVIVFGNAQEVLGDEKKDGLCALLKKFLNDDEYSKYKKDAFPISFPGPLVRRWPPGRWQE